MLLSTWHRIFAIGLSVLLVMGANLAGSGAVWQPITAHAATTWTGGSATGSGAAPWETFHGVDVGGGVSLSVSLANGNLMVETGGLEFPQMNGMDLSVLPLFNSLSKGVSTDMGNGWRAGTGRDVGLVVTPSSATFYDESGHSYVFNQPSSCSFTPPPGIDAQLACSGSNYTLTFNQSHFQYQFNGNGYLTALQNREGNLISFAYDASNRLTTITGPISLASQKLTVSYDSQNRISTVADATGRGWTYGYDSNNNLTTITDPLAEKTTFTYDGSGNLAQIADPKGNVTLINYGSGAGNSAAVTSIVRVTDKSTNSGPTWSYGYGTAAPVSVSTLSSASCGSAPVTGTATATLTPTQVTDPNGHIMTYALDSSGRATNITNPDNTTEELSWTSDHHVQHRRAPSGATTAYAYDGNNNLTQVTLATGACSRWQYGNSNQPYQPSAFTDDIGNTTSFAYDSKGLLTTVTNAMGKTSTAVYDPMYGVMNSFTDENGHVTRYSYNSLRLVGQISASAPRGTQSYIYNSHNLLSSYSDALSHLTTYAYDALDQPLTVTDNYDNTRINYAYDANGNQTGMTDSSGVTSWSYNALDQVTQKSLPNRNTISYTWDGVDNLLTKADGGGTLTYGYTVNDELSSVQEPSGALTTLSYDQDGNQTKVAYPNGIAENMGFDAAGHLTSIGASGCPPLQVCPSFSYSYTNPANNQPTTQRYSMTDQASGKTTTYGYDPLNQLTQAIEKDGGGAQTASYSYAYDPVDNMSSENRNGSNTSMTYNTADQMMAAGSTTFNYDGNGNLTGSSLGASFTYNARQQATNIKAAGGSAVAMGYAGEGQTQRTSSGSSAFQYDETGISTTTANNATTYFTNGADGSLVSERIPNGSGFTSYYYLYDGLGSVVALTDGSGNIVNRYSYDPYGNATSISEQVSNPFRFTGAIWDSSTGLYKMGERYYDPTVGRFTTADPIADASTDYTYAGNNPINATDPTGVAEEPPIYEGDPHRQMRA